jgi:uncharacterized protein (DUF2147 family)
VKSTHGKGRSPIRSAFAAAALLACATPAVAASAIDGSWITQDGKAVVNIAPCGSAHCGTITRMLKPPAPGVLRDIHNPDARLRDRPIVGLFILTSLVATDGEWRGHIYDPEQGRSYRAVLRANPSGTLKVQGCISLFCRTLIWKPAR